MKIGDYVRTKHYGILKVLDIFNENGKTKVLKKKGHTVTIYDDEVLKEDIEPINLIEVGDYVNGHRVNYINKDRKHFNISFGDEDFVLHSKFNSDTYWLSKEDIKSIVTKEQFESMEYKLGE